MAPHTGISDPWQSLLTSVSSTSLWFWNAYSRIRNAKSVGPWKRFRMGLGFSNITGLDTYMGDRTTQTRYGGTHLSRQVVHQDDHHTPRARARVLYCVISLYVGMGGLLLLLSNGARTDRRSSTTNDKKKRLLLLCLRRRVRRPRGRLRRSRSAVVGNRRGTVE